ncbi:MAG TPA: 7TM-DISM domain-containing protein [Polyangiales bacterium]|nr:7TM-DISM domain-containing protein [Polyangiales bacterium]
MIRLLALLLVLCPLSARARDVIDVASELRGVSMQNHVEWLEDAQGTLGVESVVSSRAFRSDPDRTLNFGFSESAYWLRFRIANHASLPRALMLEVAHPQLDYVTLYVPTSDGGFDVRRTGDQLPFSQRDLAYRNFVFTLEQPPGEAQTYYLRVQTSGVVELPINLWTVEQFVEHQHLDWAVLCVYYGVLLMLTLYAFALSLFTRETAGLQFGLLVLITGLFQLARVGHATQYLFPGSPYLAQVAVPVSLALIGACNWWFGKHMMLTVRPDRPRARLFNTVLAVSLAQSGLAFVLPVRQALLLQVSIHPVLYVLGGYLLVSELRRGTREAWPVLISFLIAALGAVVSSLMNAGHLPITFFTVWSYQFGVVLQFFIIAATASLRLRVLRNQLASVNEELKHKIDELEEAVVSAERATRLTEWATRVKDEFMATMSHELRTPLNTIINIPQGLVEEFVSEATAVCGHCAAVFVLDPGEQLLPGAACLACGNTSLSARERVRFAGDGTRAVRYLEKIERSGTHLLGVVNGMLAADKGEIGRVVLQRDWLDVRELASGVVEDMSDFAERAGVKLVLEAEQEPVEQSVDPLRLRQILINLIGNAIKFSNGQGTVRVQVTRDASGAQLAVQDEGIGIAPDKLASVFGSYQQAHEARAYGGTGLGLSISRSLVRAHAGELTVESEPGKGSTFRFHIPRRRREQKSA